MINKSRENLNIHWFWVNSGLEKVPQAVHLCFTEKREKNGLLAETLWECMLECFSWEIGVFVTIFFVVVFTIEKSGLLRLCENLDSFSPGRLWGRTALVKAWKSLGGQETSWSLWLWEKKKNTFEAFWLQLQYSNFSFLISKTFSCVFLNPGNVQFLKQ